MNIKLAQVIPVRLYCLLILQMKIAQNIWPITARSERLLFSHLYNIHEQLFKIFIHDNIIVGDNGYRNFYLNIRLQ